MKKKLKKFLSCVPVRKPFLLLVPLIAVILLVSLFAIKYQRGLNLAEMFVGEPAGTTVTKSLTATADTFVQSDTPTTIYGTRTYLRTRSSSPARITYLKFDTTSVKGLNITKAVLRLRVAGDPSSSVQRLYKLASSSWTESTTSYNNNRPALPSSYFTTFTPSTANAYKEIDITSTLKANTTNTLSLAITSTGTNTAEYYSRNNTTSSSYKPTLIVSYLVASTSTPTPTVGGISAQGGAPYYGGAEGPLPVGANPGIDTVVEYAAFRGKAVLFAGALNNQTNRPLRAANGAWERHTTSSIPSTPITMFNAYGAYSGARVYVIGTWYDANPTVQKWFTKWYNYDPDSTTADGWLNVYGASGHSDRGGIVFGSPAFYHVNNQVLASLIQPVGAPNTWCSVVVKTYTNSNPVEIDYKWVPTNNTYQLLLSQGGSSKVYTASAALNCTSFTWPNTANYTTANRRQTAESYIDQASALKVVYINSSNQLVNWPYSVSVPTSVYALDVTSNGSILVLQDTTGKMWVCPVSGSCTPFMDNGHQLTIATGISFQITKLEGSAVQLIWGGGTPCSAVYPEAGQAVNSCSPVIPTSTPTPTPTRTPTPTPTTPPSGNYKIFLPVVLKQVPEVSGSWTSTNIGIQNIDNLNSRATLTLYSPDGTATQTIQKDLSPLGSVMIAGSDLPAGQYSGVVNANTRIAAAVTNVNTSAAADFYTGENSPAKKLTLPLIFRTYSGGWSSTLYVQNTSGSSNVLSNIKLYKAGQTVPAVEVTRTIKPYSVVKLDLSQGEFAAFGSDYGYAVVSSTDNLAVVLDNFRNTTGQYQSSWYTGVPDRSSGKELLSPLVFNGYSGGWNTGLQVVNLESSSTSVELTYTTSAGAVYKRSQTFAPGESKAFYLPSLSLPVNTYGSATVKSSVANIVALASSAKYIGGSAGYASIMLNPLIATKKVALPLVFVGSSSTSWLTGVQVVNLDTVQRDISAILVRAGTDLSQPGDFYVFNSPAPAKGAVTFYLPSLISGDFSGAAFIESEGPIMALGSHTLYPKDYAGTNGGFNY